VVDGAIATRAKTPAVLSGREGGGGHRSADAVLPGQKGSGVFFARMDVWACGAEEEVAATGGGGDDGRGRR
jgi:hypothetical protein